jgi:hypothetical protein
MARVLQPITRPGRRLVAMAEELATAPAEDAAGVGALRATGYLASAVPVELGGLDADSVHDQLVACSRLARGDALLALDVNHHVLAVLAMTRRWRMAVARGDERRAQAAGAPLRAIAAGGPLLTGDPADPDPAAVLLDAAVSLGVAEAAHAQMLGADADPDASAENAVDLITARAVLTRAAALIDAHHDAHPFADGDDEARLGLAAEAQAAAAAAGAACGRIVDRARTRARVAVEAGRR